MRTKERRRVAVTGVGLVTPVGNDTETTWSALLAGRSGGARISLFDASGFSTSIAAEVKGFRNVLIDDRKIWKFTNRSHRFALEAAEQALLDAGIRPTPEDGHRWGCAVGAGMMTADFADLVQTHAHCAPDGELVTDQLLTDVPANDPLVFCRGQATEGVALLTKRYGIRGYTTSVHTACASGGQAFGTALKLIRRGYVDRVLAGGFDSMISPVGIAGFCLLSALSADNDTPERASRPFDATRNGFLLGEGAGFVVLEEWTMARKRGARIYAELAGDGNSLSSYRITDSPPDGDGPIQAMRQALADAGASTGDVDYINAHGTSTLMNDRSESAAIHAVFGDGAKRVPVSSTKSTMGHLIAAAGAVEGVVCALAIARGEMPINANLRERDADCDLNLVVGEPRRGRVRMTMSNSFGFGGSNSCIVMRHPDLV
jgi:3-oxoacyl-(acyl-carrier-protein) synthase